MKLIFNKNKGFFLWSILPALMLVFTFLGINLVSRNVQTHVESVTRRADNCGPNTPPHNWSSVDYFGPYFTSGSSTLTELCGAVGVTDNVTCQNLGADCLSHRGGRTPDTTSVQCWVMAQYLLCNVGRDVATSPYIYPDLTANRSDHCTREYCNTTQCAALSHAVPYDSGTGAVPPPTLDPIDTTSAGCFTPPPMQRRCEDAIFQTGETCEFQTDRTQIIPSTTPGGTLPLPAGLACRTAGTPAPCTYCGDGNQDAGEECDLGYARNGQPGELCDSKCKKATIPANTPSNVCGDGNIAGGETCEFIHSETGIRKPVDASIHGLPNGICRDPTVAGTLAPYCTYCGDGHVDTSAGEDCDDGPLNGTIGRCSIQCKNPVCGDGLINSASETCEFKVVAPHLPYIPSSIGPQAFPAGLTCRAPGVNGECSYCGDGIVQTNAVSPEQCDLGSNATAADYNGKPGGHCTIDCQIPPTVEVIPRCGDGTINQDSETCDGTVLRSPSYSFLTPEACRSATAAFPCTYCGDHVWQQGTGGEVCDASAFPNLTGCAAGESCDNCNRCVPIPHPSCGNGNLEPGEACDNHASPTGCAAGTFCNDACTCQPNPTPAARCGDGVLQTGEECEPPNTLLCDSTCRNITPSIVVTPDNGQGLTPDGLRLQGSGRLGCDLYMGEMAGMNVLSFLPYFASLLGFALLRKRK